MKNFRHFTHCVGRMLYDMIFHVTKTPVRRRWTLLNNKPKMLLVDSSVLPEVVLKVLEAKTLIAKGIAKSPTEAARMLELSRSTFYKYKDRIFYYNQNLSNNMLTLYAILHDEPGILSRFLSEMYKYGINIITVNQNIPIDSVASVTLSLRIEKEDFDAESFSQNLKEMPGVVDVRILSRN